MIVVCQIAGFISHRVMTIQRNTKRFITHAVALCLGFSASLSLAEKPGSLPDPDGKEADMSKPVQVYILMGQSNMLGFGKINGGDGSLTHATKEKGLYP